MDIITVIREELQLRENEFGKTIPELAQTFKSLGYPDDNIPVIQQILLDAYRKDGDQGVTRIYEEMTGVQIQVLRRGRYVFAGLNTPRNYDVQKFVAETIRNQ